MKIAVFFKKVAHVFRNKRCGKFFGTHHDQHPAILHRPRHLVVKPSLQTNAGFHFQGIIIFLPFFGGEREGFAVDNLARGQSAHELE